MAATYSAVTQLGLLSQQYPPPLLPKPGKDNVRLQKLLKRTAKKKASAQASQSAAPFRSSLSPVNEASPDLEHSDHSTPPKTPETPFNLYSTQHPPRFTVRPLYQHVASPYPQRAAYGRATRFSPQTVAMPSYSYSQVTTVSSYPAPEPVVQLTIPKISLPTPSVPEATAPATQVTKPAFSTFAESHSGLRPASSEPVMKPTQTSPGPTPYPAAGGQALIRPLTVLTSFSKPKSPRPTFKATEPSRSPKPMFDVPKIRMYTASTSYYESSRTPPVYDTAGLTAIGSAAQDLTQASYGTEPQRRTPTSETKRGLAPPEVMTTTPTPEAKRATPTLEAKRATPTSEIKRATPTSEVKRATPTLEAKRATPTETKRATPTSETKRATPTSETKRATPTSETKRATPTSETKRATPTSESRVKTPTYEMMRAYTGRPRTPAYHITRATTPVFEISRPNPLLFAVSPITVESERSRAPPAVSAAEGVKTAEPKPPKTIPNGDIHHDVKPAARPTQQMIIKSKSEPDLTKSKSDLAPGDSQRLTQTPSQPSILALSSHGYQRPRTPTYEATRLLSSSPGYKRPRTPTYGTSPSGRSPVGFQRPKTPTQMAQKSHYRGLTPAEYAAYGGIKTYTPAFGITTSMTQGEEVKAEQKTAEPSVKEQAVAQVSEVNGTPKVTDKIPQKDEKAAAPLPVPVIIVSQASDTFATTLTKETSKVSSQAEAKQEKTVIQEKRKDKPAAVMGKPSEKPKIQETKVQEEAKPVTKTPEAKHPLPKSDNQDPLKAVRKLLGKEKVQTVEQKSGTTKAAVLAQKEPEKAVSKTEAKGLKPSVAAPKTSAAEAKGSEDKGKGEKTESDVGVKSAPEKKESDESLPAAEPLLKVLQKPKGAKGKMSGWSRLKKHCVVEQEAPQFPVMGSSQKQVAEQDQTGPKKAEETKTSGGEAGSQDENQSQDAPKATKMWDAVLFQMFSSKENIMHQIELSKSEEEKGEEKKGESKEIPAFAHRLPVLLFSPKFDAKRLKEAASRPVTKISTVFEMGLIGRKGKEEEPKDFNRKARGFTAT